MSGSLVFYCGALKMQAFLSQNLQGLLKQTLPLDEKQGQALCLDVCRDFLVLVTTNCFLRIWKVDCTELKPHGPISGRRVTFSGDEKLVVTSVRCNSDCSRISLLVKCGRDTGENSHIVVFDTIIDRFFSYNFRHLQKVPTSHCWDSGEPRLIVCETAQEEDARVAAVAIQLGLLDAARQLYIGCKRFDLLKRLYETCGEWDKAIEVASKHDRVHLKGTLHAYAKHLESLGSIKDAIHHYEVSGSHRHEVPRMLYSVQQMKELQDYIDKSVDPPLQRWWAHFCEANNLLPQAIDYYTVAGDVTSLVRVYCFKGDFSTAAALVLESSDAAAAFSLARQYEKSGNIRQAIKFFSKAAKFTYAARLAMKHNIDNELLALSLQSTKEMMTQAAKYYEDKRKYEEAVLLYHKGGDLEKAINVCFRTQLYDALKAIAEDLDKDEDPALLAK